MKVMPAKKEWKKPKCNSFGDVKKLTKGQGGGGQSGGNKGTGCQDSLGLICSAACP